MSSDHAAPEPIYGWHRVSYCEDTNQIIREHIPIEDFYLLPIQLACSQEIPADWAKEIRHRL